MLETVEVSVTDIQRMLAQIHPDWTVRKIGTEARKAFEALKSDKRN